MDVFRSATLAITVILLIFMGMLMYYEFKVNVNNVKYPPYTRDCPDYSYNYNLGDGSGEVCMFDTNNFNYKRFLKMWDDGSRKEGDTLCTNLYCQNDDNDINNFTQCTWQNPATNSVDNINKLYFKKNQNTNDNIRNIRSCKLTLDGIV